MSAACVGRLADGDLAALGDVVGDHDGHDGAKDGAASGEFGNFDHGVGLSLLGHHCPPTH